MSAADLGRGIGAGRIDPVALTDCYLDAIGQAPESPRIYARTTPDRARAEARAAAHRAKTGDRASMLDGVPISWKDLFDTAGTATEAGSALLAGRIPLADAPVLQKAQAMGLVCLGKTHMSELAFSGLGYNPVTQTPPCVNDANAVSGGSSSGAAASVAFGLAACGIGSDTGGSVRVPAAWNDLVGLKTSAGRLPLQGVVPLAKRFDTIGPLCRTVEDAALMLAALEANPRPADLQGASLQGVRLLQLDTIAMEGVADAPARAYEAALSRLAAAGAVIERRDIPQVREAMALAGALYCIEAYAEWHDVIEAAPDKMFAEVLARFRSGADFSSTAYAQAWMQLENLRAHVMAQIAGYDAVIMPTVASMPPELARVAADTEFYVAENLLALRNTRIGNLVDFCGLTLPTGQPSCGILLNCPARQEERLLRLGAAAERALA